MTSINTKSSIRIALISVALALVPGSAFADKPSWAGGERHKEGREQNEEKERGERSRGANVSNFDNDDRRIVSEYYGTQARKGKCPPGLAKKNNHCLPPGQEKKWKKGFPLARDIEYHELPRELRMRLPAPPPDHRYIQVAGDILMIATGTGMVVDAIEDILR